MYVHCFCACFIYLLKNIYLFIWLLPANAGNIRDVGLIPGLGRSPRVGNGNPLWYSCLENSMDREAWWATVHGVAKSQDDSSVHTRTHLPASGLSCNMWGALSGHAGPFVAVLHSLVVALRFNCSKACGILAPGPGIEPVSPALEGGFLTVGPPRKSPLLPALHASPCWCRPCHPTF